MLIPRLSRSLREMVVNLVGRRLATCYRFDDSASRLRHRLTDLDLGRPEDRPIGFVNDPTMSSVPHGDNDTVSLHEELAVRDWNRGRTLRTIRAVQLHPDALHRRHPSSLTDEANRLHEMLEFDAFVKCPVDLGLPGWHLL